MHWGPMVIESVLFNAFEDGGNVYTGYWYRNETLTGKWWGRYVASVQEWRWNRWADNNPVLDDYVGHPMMGAITNSIWIQNDPKGMTLGFENDWPYWRSRLRALAWSTFYSFAWKLGPLGEASVGHNGDHFYYDNGVYTNETGWVELVTTPVGGLGWTVAEDYLDKHVVTKLEAKSHNPILLTMDNFLTPARGFANILRFRPPWYRDSRIVKANSFWSDAGDGVTASTAEAMRYASRHPDNSGVEAYLAEVSARARFGSARLAGTGWQARVWGLVGIFGDERPHLGIRRRREVHAHRSALLVRVLSSSRDVDDALFTGDDGPGYAGLADSEHHAVGNTVQSTHARLRQWPEPGGISERTFCPCIGCSHSSRPMEDSFTSTIAC